MTAVSKTAEVTAAAAYQTTKYRSSKGGLAMNMQTAVEIDLDAARVTPTETLLAMEFRHAKERADLIADLMHESYAAGLNDRGKPGTISKMPTVMQQVTDRVAREYGMDPRELRGSSRTSDLHQPRRVIWCELRERGYSFPQIGRFFGRDHTSIKHGVDKYLAGQNR